MTVKARFYVSRIDHRHTPNSDDMNVGIELQPVYGDENKDWSRYTPQGKIEMTVTNPAAIEQFELGKIYELSFTPIEA